MSYGATNLSGISPFNWRDAPRQTTNTKAPKQSKPFNGLRAATKHPNSITVTGMEQGRADWAKLQLTRGAAR